MPVGPACRYPDPITHDGTTPCGATTPLPSGPDPQQTLIEGLPAAHMMHGVACTGVTAAGPIHPPATVPMPIVLGSPTVFVGNMPLARWLPGMDTAGCGTFLGSLSAAPGRTTLIGDGGGAVPPLPVKMVWVGGMWLMKIGNSIYAMPAPGNPGYQGQVAEAYQRLNALSPNMRNAIATLDGTGQILMITMYYPNPATGAFNATTTPTNFNASMPKGTVFTDSAGNNHTGTGTGSSSIIAWDPNINGNGTPAGQPGSNQKGADLKLAHETDHGVHNAAAIHDPGYTVPGSGGIQTNEERNTVGLPAQPYNGAPGDPNNGAALPDTTVLPYTENGTTSDYQNAGVNAPYDPVQNPGPPQPAPNRPSYFPGGQPF